MRRKIRYIWLDDKGEVRNKLKVANNFKGLKKGQFEVNEWNFDGSSTNQSTTEDSDLIIKPCRVYVPFHPQHPQNFKYEDFEREIIVLCTVHTNDGEPVESENRPALEKLNEKYKSSDWWFGIEQEYTMFQNGRPLGWDKHVEPAKQGPYYCGVGEGKIVGEEISNEHVDECIIYDIDVYGTNAEVMLGQWEYQIGTADALKVSDDIIVSRYLLHRVAQNHKVEISLAAKPMRGDWNGAGAHTNFSTKPMRNAKTGKQAISSALTSLSKTHSKCIPLYGDDIDKRLIGTHETSSIHQFSHGEKNRSCSVRIPISVAKDGYGYLEDRRPCADVNPYTVCLCIMSSVENDIEFFQDSKPKHIVELLDHVSEIQRFYNRNNIQTETTITFNNRDKIMLLRALDDVLNSASNLDLDYVISNLPFGKEVSSLKDINDYVFTLYNMVHDVELDLEAECEYNTFTVDCILRCMVTTLRDNDSFASKTLTESIKSNLYWIHKKTEK